MIGKLVEYHNPAPGERYGIIKEKKEDGKFKIVTGWYGFSGGKGSERTSSGSTFLELSPQQILNKRKSIEEHFERIWSTKNAKAAETKTICFSNNSEKDQKLNEIKYLPQRVAESLEDYFLSEGWFAYVK
jgi:hypothetical protein